MNSARTKTIPLPLTLNLIDATAVLKAIACLSDDLAALRQALAGGGKRDCPSEMMTTRQVARYLQVNPRTVARWVSDGQFPNGVKLMRTGSSRRLWRRADVESWLTQHGK